MSLAIRSRLATMSVALLVSSATASRADWEYTKWGMTPEQVAKASQGTVKVIPPDKRTRDAADQNEMAAEGKYLTEKLALDVGFMFDPAGGGLACVMYNALGDDALRLGKILAGRYGAPSKESDFMSSHTTLWIKPDEIEYTIRTKQPVAAVVSHCAPQK
jgi:hypothetical protein